MQPVECGACGNRVLVEKYSSTHTSTQWIEDAESACVEFREAAANGTHSMFVRTCGALTGSIDEAVAEGRLGESYRTVPVSGSTAEVRPYS